MNCFSRPFVTQKEHIIIGITGGIAAYKVCDLIRLFVKQDYRIHPIMTESATRFITPLTISCLATNKVLTDIFDEKIDWDIEHVELAQKAQMMIIAPATANIMAKIANGIADDFLSLTALTFAGTGTKPLVVAPSMNFRMYNHVATRQNMDILRQRGVFFIDPDKGELACGEIGEGRLAPVEKIFSDSIDILKKNTQLKNIRAIVTAGGTREPVDSVRVISNRSSGKMGYAVAAELKKRGALVTLISSVDLVNPGADELIRFETCTDLKNVLDKAFNDCDMLIMAAAVSDFTVADPLDKKLHRSEGEISITLVPSVDIISSLARNKGKRLVIGFAAESENPVERAVNKLNQKNLDMIIANDISRSDIGFNSDYNEVVIITGSDRIKIGKATKNEVAAGIIDKVVELMKEKDYGDSNAT
jgi:phosphopantothenoylcysteine decarboxylase/phosphopantothenate--cysteine ligase